MRSVGFPISRKKNEKRRALIPSDISDIKYRKFIFVESGYGNMLGFCDDDYISAGVNICSRSEALTKDIICDPKIGDAEYLTSLNNQIIFGWVHAVQNYPVAECLRNQMLTCYAWEDMFENGRHIFYKNNEIAGEAAILHAFIVFGMLPCNTKIAILGRGNTANGALKMLNCLGADVTVYNKNTEYLFRSEMELYDVIINAILWDTKRTDHIIYKQDLKMLKKNTLIIDISCDKNGGIETSKPTTVDDPIYYIEGIAHYAVDHTPTLLYKTVSLNLSKVVAKYIDYLIVNEFCKVLDDAKNCDKGEILDRRIISRNKTYTPIICDI